MTNLPSLSIREDIYELYEKSPLGDALSTHENPIVRWLGDALAQVWHEHEIHLAEIDVVKAIESRSIRRELYMAYLRDMRQQVIEGARWISLAASSMDESHSLLRFALIKHATTEHRDFKMLENDYVAMGGNIEDIVLQSKNIGSQALDAYVSYQAQRPNPVHAFGASFIIEGMGSQKAGAWANKIQQSLNCDDNALSFLSYHGKADVGHNQNLVSILSSPFVTESVAVKTYHCAKIVSRLYALQLSEINTRGLQ